MDLKFFTAFIFRDPFDILSIIMMQRQEIITILVHVILDTYISQSVEASGICVLAMPLSQVTGHSLAGAAAG